jgi:hypothetical protein
MDIETTRETKMIRVSAETWEKAKKMAALRKVKGQEGAEIGAVTDEAIADSWEKLPPQVRDFLEQSDEPEAEQKVA